MVLLALLLCSSGVGARAQVVDAEAGFVARIAQERAARGLPGYQEAADLRDVARRHAQRMADEQRHFHNPNLGSEVGGWSTLAENVGVGPTVDGVHAAFMDSDVHRSTILHADLTQVGIGVVRGTDNRLYVVQVFRRPEAPAPPPTTAPPTTAAPAPPVASPPAPPVTEAPAPPTTAVAPAPEVTAPSSTAEQPQLAAAPVAVAAARTTAVPARKAKAVIAPATEIDLGPIEADVPTAGWVAAFLLAGVVALQGQTLRRLGLA